MADRCISGRPDAGCEFCEIRNLYDSVSSCDFRSDSALEGYQQGFIPAKQRAECIGKWSAGVDHRTWHESSAG